MCLAESFRNSFWGARRISALSEDGSLRPMQDDDVPFPDLGLLLTDGWAILGPRIQSCFSWTKRVIAFTRDGTAVYSDARADGGRTEEKNNLRLAVERFDDRDEVLRRGVRFDGSHFDVHQHHPGLAYGRDPLTNTGFAICQLASPVNYNMASPFLFILITYELPTVSAFAVGRLKAFATNYNIWAS